MTLKAFNTSDVPKFRRVVTVILKYIIHYKNSECSIRVVMTILLEYIDLNEYICSFKM